MDINTWKAYTQKYPAHQLKNDAGELIPRWKTPVARLAFANIVKPREKVNKQTGEKSSKYGCCLILHPDADISVLSAAAGGAATARFGAKAGSLKLRSPFKPQLDLHGRYDGFLQSGIYLDVETAFQPAYIAANGKDALPISEETIWAGMYVRAVLTCYAYDTDGNRGVRFGFNSLQFVSHGEKFKNTSMDPADHYEAIEDLGGLGSVSPGVAAAPSSAGQPAAAPANPAALFGAPAGGTSSRFM